MKHSIMLLLVFFGTSVIANDNFELDLTNLVKAAEIKYGLQEGILEAMIEVESGGNHRALNRDDGTKAHKIQGIKIASFGLLQMQLATARFIQRLKAKSNGFYVRRRELVTPNQLMMPETNIEYGAAYLSWLLRTHHNNYAWALTCYNSGPASGACKNKKYLGNYVGKVLNSVLVGRQ